MRAFAQKSKTPQKGGSAQTTNPLRAYGGQSGKLGSILRLQRAMDSQAVPQTRQAKPEDFEASTVSDTRTGLTHDFSRIPIFGPSPVQLQPKLTTNTPGDIYEQEADRVADAVMLMPDPTKQEGAGYVGHVSAARIQGLGMGSENVETTLRRQPIEEEEELQTKPLPNSRRDGGQRLPESERTFFEQRFGANLSTLHIQEREPTAATHISMSQHLKRSGGSPLPQPTNRSMSHAIGPDFSNVRVHTDKNAETMSRQLGARAFTHGSDIYFNRGEFQPESRDGKHLLAHELTHVVQQTNGGIRPHTIQRLVAGSSRCPANADGAGSDPLSDLRNIDQDSMVRCLGAALGLAFDSNAAFNELMGGRQNTDSFRAYQRRFGMPEQLASGRFRNRFNGRTFADQEDAVNGELEILSDRFSRLADTFGRNIRYRCVGTGQFRVGSCTATTCGATQFAAVCDPSMTVAICPHFWNLTSDQQAAGLIHELAHVRFGFGDPAGSSMTTRRRGSNPVCYSGLVAEIDGGNPPDPDCPRL